MNAVILLKVEWIWLFTSVPGKKDSDREVKLSVFAMDVQRGLFE